jgi:glycosyltransferase involved in cell wall biosynthesis
MPRRTLARRLADRCYRACRPLLRRRLAADLVELVQQRRRPPFTLPLEPEVQLSGVVYTMVLQPGPRKSWQELLSAFVWALGACPDATLVLRIVTRDQERPEALAALADYYRRLSGVSHQCRVVLLPEAMPDELMLRLADATTYYVNATLAEGACLPLQEMLAAGRPALSPVHSAMRDYFDADVGFVIASDREPCSLPGDDTGLLKTTWHRLNWESLHNQFQASYDLAKQPRAYAALAARARQRLHQWAGPEHVFILLKEALLPLAAQAAQPYAEPPWLKSAEEPRAEDQAA